MGSNIDCRDNDDASVLLPPSPSPRCVGAGDKVGGVEIPKPEFPVISNLLKASTSMDALPGLVTLAAGGAENSLPGFSIVSNVFEKGFFIGACAGLTTPTSSSRASELAFSNGSPSLGIGVGGFVYVSSPIVEEESGIEGVDGEGGGGDWTRTFLGTFLGIST